MCPLCGLQSPVPLGNSGKFERTVCPGYLRTLDSAGSRDNLDRDAGIYCQALCLEDTPVNLAADGNTPARETSRSQSTSCPTAREFNDKQDE